MNNINVLSDVIAINLEFSIWTGRKTLAAGDVSLAGEMPPKEIISLGSKHTTNPKALKIFNTLKRRAERACKSVGIPFMGGYAIPVKKANDIANTLHEILAQFELEKSAYLLKHAAIQDEWINKYPEYKNALIKALTDTKEVEGRINASFSMFKVQSVESEIGIDTGITKQVNALNGALDKDVVKEAGLLLESLNSAIRPNQVNVKGLVKLREKVEGLAFLNQRFSILVNEIRKVEVNLPVAGNLSFDDQNKLSGLLYRMREPSRLAELMQQIITPSVENVADAKVDTSLNKAAESILLEADFEVGSTSDSSDSSEFEFEFDFDFDERTQLKEDKPAQEKMIKSFSF
ncbi:DUF3150 domain-containing protein [Psychromonas sp. KJ10-2]|uniref:DUF3150 domain-containing protein n=1 Tax=Psychromonas sp. KJ10-2 TaxID=3391822 RepID=UPI0039B4C386